MLLRGTGDYIRVPTLDEALEECKQCGTGPEGPEQGASLIKTKRLPSRGSALGFSSRPFGPRETHVTPSPLCGGPLGGVRADFGCRKGVFTPKTFIGARLGAIPGVLHPKCDDGKREIRSGRKGASLVPIIAPFTIRQFADDLLVVVLLLTVPMAILAMRLAEKALKKQASVLNNL